MSFILDALRKSELERKRQSGPTLAATPPAPRRNPVPWPFLALGVLLALNLVGLLGFWIWRETRTAEPAPTAATDTPRPAARETVAARIAASPEQRVVRPLASEVTSPETADATPQVPPPPSPELLPEHAPPAPVASSGMPATAAQRSPDAIDAIGVPRIEQLSATATAGLPELNMDLHVYQPDAARRFVFINGVRYGEGATMKEGPVVERITRDGAVLNHRGVRFLIERP